MAKSRYINTKFWDDTYISSLDPIEKLLFIYFLTNPLTEISGAYEIQLKRVALDTGIDRDMVQKILNRFADEDKIIYRDGWILVCNFIKHQSLNPNVQIGIENAVDIAPQWIRDRLSIAFESLSYLNLNNSNLNQSNDNESDEVKALKKKQETLDVTNIFQFWKDTMSLNGSTKLTANRKTCVQARLREGYTIERIKNAILGCAASPFHCGQNDSRTLYNDLTLICRNGEKVEFFEQKATDAKKQTLPQSELDARDAVRAGMEAYGR